MHRSPRSAALLLVGATVVLSACGPATGSGRDSDTDTTATRAPSAPAGPGTLPVRDDLVDPQVVSWRTWRATGDRTIEVTVTAGPPDCYGAEPEVVESKTAVRVRVRVGRLPEATGRECRAIAREAVVPIRLAAPLGTREVQRLT